MHNLPVLSSVTATPGIFRKPGSQERVDALWTELSNAGRLHRLTERIAKADLYGDGGRN